MLLPDCREIMFFYKSDYENASRHMPLDTKNSLNFLMLHHYSNVQSATLTMICIENRDDQAF
jgi:hypothetical protein